MQNKIKDQVAQFAGKSSADVVGNIVQTNASQPKKGVVATVVGVVIALFGASGVFGALQDSLNTIWGVKAKPGAGESWATSRRGSSPLAWWAECVFCCSCR